MWNTLGFPTIKRFFEKALKEGPLNHSYLFTGQDRIGKWTFARELATKLASPSAILEVTTHDIDTVRTAKLFLSHTAFHGDRKVVLIDNAHLLSEEAQNALLKILEEPSSTSILLLVTSRKDGVLPTIASRCQEIVFPVPGRDAFDAFFATKKLSHEQQDFLFHFSNGSIGLLFDEENFKKIKVFAEEFSTLAKATMGKRFDVAKQLAEDEELEKKILFWMLYLRTKKLFAPLGPLLALYQSIAQPQLNRQLAIENFMLELRA